MHPAFRALRSRNFRIFYLGQFVSVLGTWMQTVATSWLVYRLSDSAFLLGLTAFAQQIPLLFLSPVAGVVADRANRQRVLVITQSLAILQAALLALLTFLGVIQVWHVVCIAVFLGLVNSFETPTRQAFLLEMIEDRSDLPNAIALQSMLMNSTRLIGPSIAGIVLAAFGEAWCFVLNTVSYSAIVFAYAALSVRPRAIRTETTRLLEELADGFRYAFGTPASRRLLVLLGTIGFFSAPWQTLLPIFAAESFGGDSKTFGFLIGAVGVGALIGTIYLANRQSVRGLGNIIAVCSTLAGVSMIAFSFAQSFRQSLLVLPLFGFGLIVTAASTNQLLQTIADDDKRGRMVSLYVMTFLGIAPIGNLFGGVVASIAGAHWTLRLNGIAFTLISLWFIHGLATWRESVRAIYAAKGIGD